MIEKRRTVRAERYIPPLQSSANRRTRSYGAAFPPRSVFDVCIGCKITLTYPSGRINDRIAASRGAFNGVLARSSVFCAGIPPCRVHVDAVFVHHLANLLRVWMDPEGLLPLPEKDVHPGGRTLQAAPYELLRDGGGPSLYPCQVHAIQAAEITNRSYKNPPKS